MKGCACIFVVHCTLLAVSWSCASGQSSPSNAQPVSTNKAPVETTDENGRVGAAVKFSTYGGGGEVAVSVTHRTNVRAGFNVISYSRGFDKDGIHYSGQVDLKTFEAHYDIFPWAKSFRVSGGVLVYAADPVTATASVPGNQSFTLGGVTYYSDPANPTRSAGKIVFNRAAPTVTFGFGNIVPRSKSKHFSVPVEFGIAFHGSPKTTLAVGGSVCDAPGGNCRSVASDPNVQSNVIAQQNKIDNDLSFFKVYPIFSVGFGYKF
jgi:hypothetical protein